MDSKQKQELEKKIRESFPYEPYNIQLEFSMNLYQALHDKKLCIFESPTGTGKSLSLICGAFNWLKDHQEDYETYKKLKERQKDKLHGYLNEECQDIKEDSHSLPAWMSNANDINRSLFLDNLIIQKNKLSQKAQSLKEFQMFRKEKMKIRFEDYQRTIANKKSSKMGQVKEEDRNRVEEDEDQQFCVKWSDKNEGDREEEDIDALIEDYKRLKTQNNGKSDRNNLEDEDSNEHVPLKIIYASRTHSQIKQFVQEILKTKFKNLRVITLGSRQNLCLKFDDNNSKYTLSYIDDYCQKAIGVNKSDKSIPKCDYYTNLKLLQNDLEYLFMESIHTIDQMRTTSLNNLVCPYYLSKKSIADAEIICVPYITLLDENLRSSSNIDITNSIILFDESHNILENLSGIHSSEVTFKSIFAAYTQLLTYYDKFSRRLNPKNALFIQNIKNLCFELIKYIKSEVEGHKPQNKDQSNYIKINNIQLLLKLNMDRIDFFQIKKFTQETRLGQKIHFFSQSSKYSSSTLPPIVQKLFKDIKIEELTKSAAQYMVVENVMNFLWKMQDSISRGDQYSIIIKNLQKFEDSAISIMCLDVISPLFKVIDESACVVLAGGTMEPLSEFELLINQVGKQNYHHFSCGHVIDKDNCQAFCVSTLTKNDKDPLIFNFQNKQDDSLLIKSIQIMFSLSQLIPDGLVVFVQSYSFLERLKNKLLDSQDKLNQIQMYKKIFMDEKENTNNTLLEKYQKEIEREKEEGGKRNGAILISVIGGRLSEGINFSDKLARCVVVLGMPYSNIKSAELIEKMNHYDNVSKKSKCSFNGNDYYENLCMKSVNQAIGRSIRHKNDYSVILLIDSRFSLDKNVKRLSGWIKERVQQIGSFEEAKSKISQFFENKQKL